MSKLIILLAALFVLGCNSNKSEKEKDTEKTGTDTVKNDVAPLPGGKIDIETFGPIRIGQPATETIQSIGTPASKSKAIEWEADGLMHEDWSYPKLGLVLGMTSEIGNTDKTMSVFSITATTPADFRTRAGMGIGNHYKEVQQAYKRDIDTASTTLDQIVVGSVYGGIIFTFKNEKVSHIFLGAAAE